MKDLEKIAKALGLNKTLDDYRFYYGEYWLSSEEAERIKHDWLLDDICDRIEEIIAKVEAKNDKTRERLIADLNKVAVRMNWGTSERTINDDGTNGMPYMVDVIARTIAYLKGENDDETRDN